MREGETDQDEGDVLRKRTIRWGSALVVVITIGSGLILLHLFSGAGPSVTLDAIRTAGTLGVGTGGGVALLLAARKQRTTELDLVKKEQANQLQRQTFQHQLDEARDNREHARQVAEDNRHDASERRITELYSKAAEQLGSESAVVRLAGLYSLERLAQYNDLHRPTIVNLICGYLRAPYTPPKDVSKSQFVKSSEESHSDSESPIEDPSEAARKQELQVRRTAQRLLSNHLQLRHKHNSGIFLSFVLSFAGYGQQGDSLSPSADYWGPLDLDLTGACLVDFDFAGCNSGSGIFNDAKFIGTTRFDNAIFNGEVQFHRTTFEDRVYFTSSQFKNLFSLYKTVFNTWPVDFRKVSFFGDYIFAKIGFGPEPGWERLEIDGTKIPIEHLDLRGARVRPGPFGHSSKLFSPIGWTLKRPEKIGGQDISEKEEAWVYFVRSTDADADADADADSPGLT